MTFWCCTDWDILILYRLWHSDLVETDILILYRLWHSDLVETVTFWCCTDCDILISYRLWHSDIVQTVTFCCTILNNADHLSKSRTTAAPHIHTHTNHHIRTRRNKHVHICAHAQIHSCINAHIHMYVHIHTELVIYALLIWTPYKELPPRGSRYLWSEKALSEAETIISQLLDSRRGRVSIIWTDYDYNWHRDLWPSWSGWRRTIVRISLSRLIQMTDSRHRIIPSLSELASSGIVTQKAIVISLRAFEQPSQIYRTAHKRPCCCCCCSSSYWCCCRFCCS